jgi:hypothetical protein
LGDCLLWALTWKLQKYPTNLGYFVPWTSLSIILTKKLGWGTFWAIFSQTHQVTLNEALFKCEALPYFLPWLRVTRRFVK